jgi:hypothetical protein
MGRGNSEKNLSQCHFVYHKSHFILRMILSSVKTLLNPNTLHCVMFEKDQLVHLLAFLNRVPLFHLCVSVT